MGEDIVSLVHQLELKARPKILALCAITWEERERMLDEAHEKKDFSYVRNIIGALDLHNSEMLGYSVAKILSEQGNLSAAEEIYARYGYYLEAAQAVQKNNATDAKNYARKAIKYKKEIYHKFLLSVAEFFSTEEIEEAMQPLLENYKNHDRRILIEAVIAKKLGQQEKLEELYLERRERLSKAYNKAEELEEKSEDFDEKESACLETESSREYFAELCIIIGRYDEAIDMLYYGINQRWLLDEPLYSFVDKMENKKEIYKQLIEYAFRFMPPEFLIAAKAAEKLDRNKNAEEYYQKALKEEEEMLHLGTAFEIAKKLNLEEKLKVYTSIVNYMYENKFI